MFKGFLSLIFTILFFLSTSSQALENTALDQISRNTFLIVPLNSYVPTLSVEQARKKYSIRCLTLNLAVHEKLNCEVLKNCEGDSCVAGYTNQGTAFLMNNGKELHTAWHVLFSSHAAALVFAAGYLQQAAIEDRQRIYQGLEPSFVLLDRELEIVYDTRIEKETLYTEIGDPLSTVFSNSGKSAKGVYGYIENIPLDYVTVELTRSLGLGLKQADPSAKENLEGPYTSAGYGFDSKKTVFTIETGGHDTSLLKLKKQLKIFMDFQLKPMSIGRGEFWALSPEDQLVHMGYPRESAVEQISSFSIDVIESSIKTVVAVQERNERDVLIEKHNKVLITTNPSLPGASGGPFLNSKGEVVGIVTNGFSSLDSETGVKKSFGSGVHLF